MYRRPSPELTQPGRAGHHQHSALMPSGDYELPHHQGRSGEPGATVEGAGLVDQGILDFAFETATLTFRTIHKTNRYNP